MRKFRDIGIVVLVLAVFFFAVIFEEFRTARALIPSESERNLLVFLESRTNLIKIRRFTLQEKDYLEIRTKRPASLLALPSGPPAYIFDRQSLMVDWCKDSGDDSDFQRRWKVPTNASAMTVEEVKAWSK